MKKTNLLITLVFGVLCLSGCRASWQHPHRVITSLRLMPGDDVADIGAGDGYFTFLLADAVGPEGKVYAVEVTDAKVGELARRAAESGYSNIEVVLGELDDPLLPDQAIDLVFLCNTYHHIDNRTAYFSRIRSDLRQNGRVAIIDLRDDVTGIPKLFMCSGHSMPKKLLHKEMKEAGYEQVDSFDYLPVQHFAIFMEKDERQAP